MAAKESVEACPFHNLVHAICGNKKAIKGLSKNTGLPKTGLYLHPTNLENGKVQLGSVSYDYLSISEVFKHIVGQLVMEACAGIRDVVNVYVIWVGIMGLENFV